jgi:hypothetical protein
MGDVAGRGLGRVKDVRECIQEGLNKCAALWLTEYTKGIECHFGYSASPNTELEYKHLSDDAL